MHSGNGFVYNLEKINICGCGRAMVNRLWETCLRRTDERLLVLTILGCHVQIIKTATVPDDKVKRNNTLQFIGDNIKFPLPNRFVRASSKKCKTTFKASRPTTFV